MLNMTVFLFITFVFTICYVYLIILAYLGLSKEIIKTNKKNLFVSVIIPAHNSENTIGSVINTLKNQTYPDDLWEVIFIDDRSEDNTKKLIQKSLKNFKNSSLISVQKVGRGVSPKKNALLQGINKAKGEIILTTDSDTILPENWIQSMVRCYDNDVCMVLGYAPYRTDAPFDTFFHKILALEYFSMGAVSAGSCGAGLPLTSFGANLSFRKDDFLKIGGYGETIKILSGDDDLLVHRFNKLCNKKIVFNTSGQSHVKTDPPLDFKSFLRQRIRFSSKHFAYPFNAKVIMSAIYMFHINLLLLFVLTLFNLKFLPFLLLISGLKSIAELIFLHRAKKLFSERNLLKYYFPAFIPHLFYVIFIPVIAQIVSEKW